VFRSAQTLPWQYGCCAFLEGKAAPADPSNPVNWHGVNKLAVGFDTICSQNILEAFCEALVIACNAADLAMSLVVDLKPLWANSANKFFDALASGTPMVINHGGWQKTILEESMAGFAIPPNEPKKAAEMIVSKINDAQWLDEAARNARTLAAAKFDRDTLALELEGVLLRTIEEAS
jgi:glycosyltransferase involved in cell wall biosynthesis